MALIGGLALQGMQMLLVLALAPLLLGLIRKAKARLLRRQDHHEIEMLLDLSSLLISACLSGIADQIDVAFSQGHPQVLGQHAPIEELIRLNRLRWKRTLAVEISYSLEGHDIHFDLLLLFTEDSLDLLSRKLAYLMN